MNHASEYGAQFEAASRTLKACRSDASSYRRDDLDQCPATVETTLKRLALLLGMPALERMRVLLLGDDDLLAVAFAALELPTHLTVVDLDRSLLSRIARWTRTGTVELVYHDLRLGLPAGLADRYDVVFTDPPYTPAGQLLFLRAGTTALRAVKSASLFLCASRLYLSQEQLRTLVSAAERAGLKLVRIYEDFNEYSAPPDVVQDIRRRRGRAASSRFHSSLFHFSAARSVLNPESLPLSPADIYTYEEQGFARE